MKYLVVFALMLAACAPTVPESAPTDDPLGAPPPLRTDCYDSTVPPELAPAEIRDLPQC